MKRTGTYTELRARGCTCGGETYTPCAVHGPGDNRGIAAWFRAGMPQGFPMTNCTCAICGSNGCCMYPDVDLDDKTKPFVHTPTLICPRCSTPALEASRRAVSEARGYLLNDSRVFA